VLPPPSSRSARTERLLKGRRGFAAHCSRCSFSGRSSLNREHPRLHQQQITWLTLVRGTLRE